MHIICEFSGGLELLFDKVTRLDLELKEADLPQTHQGEGQVWTVRHLVSFLKDKHLKEKPELFVQGDSVRPGILVLVNDTDWELLDGLDYVLQDKDQVTFLSTLHGG